MADTENKKPTGRKKNVTGKGKGVYKRGDGLDAKKPAGSADGYSDRKENTIDDSDKGLGTDILMGALSSSLGGGQQSSNNSSAGSILGSLLGAGSNTSSQQQSSNNSSAGSILGSLLGAGSNTSSQQQSSNNSSTGSILGSLLGAGSNTAGSQQQYSNQQYTNQQAQQQYANQQYSNQQTQQQYANQQAQQQYSNQQAQQQYSNQQVQQLYSQQSSQGKKGSKLIWIIIICVVLFLLCGGCSMLSGVLGGGSGSSGGGSIISGLFGGGDSMTDMLSGLSSAGSLPTTPSTTPSGSSSTSTQTSQASSSLLNSISSNVIGGWNDTSSIDSSTGLGNVNTNIALNTRAKYTSILGGGRDTVTILVYMCGTDLESGSGMATSDLMEMTKATLSDKVNLLVYTGGCKKWRNNILSSQTNQIYQVQNGGLKCLVSNVGAKEMTKPATLTEYIKWGVANFPANRTMLIFWDHGGGSISGYGYDEKFPRSGSMTLSGINQALKDADTKFDIIGFDTCLMATVENALMLSQYGDYMVASEETEPGIGWYYTNWLTKLSANTSMPSLEIGKNIVDDFVSTCGRTCRGQLATLSVVDLAEVETTVPDALSQFSNSTVQLIKSDNYKTVSNARSHTREFATSSRIDQVDMVHLAQNINSKESKNLAKVLQSAIKYNLTSTNMTNAYGLSIYFPYNKVSSVNTIVNTYKQIGMDDDYTRCIQEFASLEVCGQASTGGFSTALPSLLGSFGGGSSDGSISSADMISQLLGGLLSSGNYGRVAGLDSTNTEFLQGRSLTDYSEYISLNQLDASKLVWKQNDDGKWVISLEDDQWELVQNLELNVFFDDGEGFIDLGLDTVYEFDKKGSLLGEFDNTWIAINEQPIAYYFLEQTIDGDNFSIMGRVPAFLNEQRVDLILIFDNEHPYGFVAGARINYDEDETETEAKGLIDIVPGDKIDFICDYYSYDGEFLDSYYLGEQMTVEADADGNAVLEISNVDIGDGEIQATYRFTDIYNQHYWTQPIK